MTITLSPRSKPNLEALTRLLIGKVNTQLGDLKQMTCICKPRSEKRLSYKMANTKADSLVESHETLSRKKFYLFRFSIQHKQPRIGILDY